MLYALPRRCRSSGIRILRQLCTSSVVGPISDDAIQLLLRTHGRILGVPALRDCSPTPAKVSVHSVLDVQLQQRQSEDVDVKPVKPEVKSSSDLSIFLGSLKTLNSFKCREKEVSSRKPRSMRDSGSPQDGPAGIMEDSERVPGPSSSFDAEDVPAGRMMEDEEQLPGPNSSFRQPVLEFEDQPVDYGGADSAMLPPCSTPLDQMSVFLQRLKEGEFRTSSDDAVSTPMEATVALEHAFPSRSRQANSTAAVDQAAETMFRTLDLVDADGLHVRAESLKTMVQSFSGRDVLEGAIEVFYATKDAGFLPTSAAYTCLVCLLLKAGRQATAAQVLGSLLLQGTRLDEESLLTLVDAFQRGGNLQLMYQLFLEIGAQDADTTNRVVAALVKADMTNEAWILATRMSTTAMSVECVNQLLESLGRQDKLFKAVDLLHRMRKGVLMCRPNLVSYNCLLNHLTRTGHLTTARKVLKLMKEDGIEADAWSYHYLIHGYCKSSKRISGAMRYMEEMKKRGLTPDAVTYSCLMSGCGRRGKTDEALELLEEMKRKNVALDVVVFNTLIHALGRCKRGKRAFLVFQEMRYRGIQPDDWTFNLLLNGLAKVGEAEAGLKMFNMMKRIGLKPSSVTYAAIIDCLGAGGQALAAYKLHNKLVARREGNTRTWNSLLKGLAKEDRVEMAYSAYQRMQRRGYQPDRITYSILLDLCTSVRDLKKVVQLQSDMRAAALEPDEGMKRILDRAIRFVRKETRSPFQLSL